jgi:hypothetical protein
MTTTGPIPYPTGPTSKAPVDWSTLIRKLDDIDRAIYALQANRAQANLLLHQLADSNQMSQAQDGHAASMDVASGGFWPRPTFAEATFHLQGALSLASSPPWHSRFPCAPVAVAADLGAFDTGPVEFNLLYNGTVLQSFSFDAASSGRMLVTTVQQLVPYTDLLTIVTTDIGESNSDLVIHVELGVTVGLATA